MSAPVNQTGYVAWHTVLQASPAWAGGRRVALAGLVQNAVRANDRVFPRPGLLAQYINTDLQHCIKQLFLMLTIRLSTYRKYLSIKLF